MAAHDNTRRTIHKPLSWGLFSLGIFLVALLFGLFGCRAHPAPTPPWPDQRKAMRPPYTSQLSLPALADAPSYRLRETVDLAQRVVQGTAHIRLTNRTSASWDSIVLRLYPNLLHYGGRMEVSQLLGDGSPLPFDYNQTHTALRGLLPQLLKPGDSITLDVTFATHYRTWNLDGYWLFGEYDGLLNMPLSYPVLAVPNDDGTWRVEDGIPLGDTLVAESSFYHVWLTVPATMTVVSSAVVSATQTYTTSTDVTYELVSGPAREFTFMLSPLYEVKQRTVNGILVRSYYFLGDEDTGEAALNYAAAALQVYSRHFGPYPFAKMDIASAMLLNRGMEYPLLTQLGRDLYGPEQRKLEFLVAHEVGHQWWYNQVGNDQIQEPWLDEGLTEYSTYYYYQDIYGRDDADAVLHNRWELPLEYIRRKGLDAPLDLPASAYTRDNYEIIVYGKGALFFHTLRHRLGDRMFERVLQTYLERYRYRLATAKDLQRVIEDVSGQDVQDLFATWVYGSPTSSPVTSPEDR
ncbi:MAG: M1 family metallopeptidase [Chloroflexi bacterium]|nr:M1 family metallopeptidase [Chloroflexota bacterium]